ncbi:MAG: hypothetical protein ACKVOU_00835 [Cytophagales bacterium]
MKNTIKILLVIVLLGLIGFTNTYAQRTPKEKRQDRHHRTVRNHHYHVRIRSQYRPARFRHYRPIWAHRQSFNRRWVYFPRYNFYWDNWRNMYYYQNNAVWYLNASPPPTVININIEEEKHYELDENDDDLDSIYKSNQSHSEQYIKK